MIFSKLRILLLIRGLLPFQKRKTTVEKYVNSFPTEKIEAMFESFLDVDDQMLNFIEKQEKLCTLAKNMDSENPLAFIKDLELQIPTLGDNANARYQLIKVKLNSEESRVPDSHLWDQLHKVNLIKI